jgi:hypothetical protein
VDISVKEQQLTPKNDLNSLNSRRGSLNMSTVNMPLPLVDDREDALAQDERWLLTQRIVHSKGFQRAAQLRAILLYASKVAILGTGEPLREDDIAREVLGRRADFDPAYDNIVRVQVSHLRRKLAEYFAGEGKHETINLVLPKGSYLSHFEPVQFQSESPATEQEESRYKEGSGSISGTLSVDRGNIASQVAPTPRLQTVRWPFLWAAGTGVLVLITAIVFGLHHGTVQAAPKNVPLILLPMLQQGGDVAVVLPDTSLMVIQQILNTEIDPVDYIVSDFPRNQVSKITDPGLREALMFLGTKKTTSFSETSIGLDWIERLAQAGLRGNLRYSRDLHVRDLSDGNVVLIGSRRSNPWMSLFSSRTNFQFIESTQTHAYSFVNTHPMQGEEKAYLPHHNGAQAVNYVDVALVRNLGEKGFALLINGSDAQANEAAVRFLLHGKLPQTVHDELDRKDFNGVEIFLRGSHLDGESNDQFEIVAFRAMHA